MEKQSFQWNDPYADVQAENAVNGSVDYYNFRWGEGQRAANASGENREDCQQLKPDNPCGAKPGKSGCTAQEILPQENPAYPIIDL